MKLYKIQNKETTFLKINAITSELFPQKIYLAKIFSQLVNAKYGLALDFAAT